MATVFSRDQISQFLEYIKIPEQYRLSADPKPSLEFLHVLHVHMITAVPYETLVLHYAQEKRVELDPQHVFTKIIGNARGRGGYCLENNILFLHMLRGLGFDVYPVGVKVKQRVDGVSVGNYVGWVHLLLIVTLPEGVFTTDVCFGGDGPTKPMRLAQGTMIRNMGTQDARLIREHIPGQTHLTETSKYWIYQTRNGEDKPWISSYAFGDSVEWLPEDYNITNTYTGGSQSSFAVTVVFMVKFLRRDAALGQPEVYGKRLLWNGTVKENTGGRTSVVEECTTEEARIKALDKWFGLRLTQDEQEAIQGHPTELKG